jgi:sugar lactone lactonase YvrE
VKANPSFILRLFFASVLMSCLAAAQSRSTQVAPSSPDNTPNPYKEVKDWAKLPPGRIWGHVFGVSIDSHKNVWVLDRCGETSCVNSKEDSILEFDQNGNFIKKFGSGWFMFPHSLYVDKEDNIWVTDCGVKNGKGNQVFKISPQGEVLMTLGKKGVLGGTPDNFYGPTDVVISPSGEVFVADGHAALSLGGGDFYGFSKGDTGTKTSRMRVLKFSKDGKFIKAWGKEGTGPGEFNMPHGIAMDSKGRLFVADRGNNRIQIFDQEGNFLNEWKQFGKPCGVAIDRNDNIYVADSDSNKGLYDWKYSVDNPCPTCLKRTVRPPDVGSDNLEWTQGIRIGSVSDGVVRALIPPPTGPEGPTTLTERLAVDADGRVYLADARTMKLRIFVKK